MKATLLLPLIPVLTIATAPAQLEAPKPAPELQKLAPMIGTWKSTGTMTPQPGMEPVPWTSKSSARWVLDGHFVREDVRIEFNDPSPSTLQFISFTGWNRERKRFQALEVSNMGTVSVSQPHFLPSGAIVGTVTAIEEGQPTIDRWISRYDGDESTMVNHRAVGEGAFFVHIKGTGKRISPEPSELEPLDIAFNPVALDKMKRFAAMIGSYDVQGSMTTAPGEPSAEITGSDSYQLIFGGTVLANHVKGQPMDYEGLGFVGWNPATNSYGRIEISNTGELYLNDAYWIDDHFVLTGSALQLGQPMVGRGLFKIDKNGAIVAVTVDNIVSANAPARIFEASYHKKK